MHRHPHCSVADHIGDCQARRGELTDKLVDMIRARAPPADIAKVNEQVAAIDEQLRLLDIEQAANLAKGGGRRHVIPPPMKIGK